MGRRELIAFLSTAFVHCGILCSAVPNAEAVETPMK